jgi:ATPase family associated with various cellular activities (AAA)
MITDQEHLYARIESLHSNGNDKTQGLLSDPTHTALARLCRACSLSMFESNLLVLLAEIAIETDHQSTTQTQGPCCSGATLVQLAKQIPEFDWAALAVDAPLRRWRLIEIDNDNLFTGRAHIEERTLLGLLGISTVAQQLLPYLTPCEAPNNPSARTLRSVHEIHQVWEQELGHFGTITVIGEGGVDSAVLSAQSAGMRPLLIDGFALPTNVGEIVVLATLLEREAAILPSAIILNLRDVDDSGLQRAAIKLVEHCGALVVVVTKKPLLPTQQRPSTIVAIPPDTVSQRTHTWRAALGDQLSAKMNGSTELIADRFHISEDKILRAAKLFQDRIISEPQSELLPILWDCARNEARCGFDGIAEAVPTNAKWDELILPDAQLQTLREVVAHVRHSHTVNTKWGFGKEGNSAQSIVALFHGPSGVGKTLAARVLASELALDLFRIDLSQTVSKYVGETEKNLGRIFDAAEQSSAVLVFDEADAIFGKRSEVKEAQDRYANIEVAYLLQRLETYRGLAILTTNLPDNVDQAFLRRLRYSVAFTFPDAQARRAIWRQAFPRHAPLDNLDFDLLARLQLSGGNITNIALGSAVLAADQNTAIGMNQLLRACQSEYAKLDRSLGAAELAGWPK